MIANATLNARFYRIAPRACQRCIGNFDSRAKDNSSQITRHKSLAIVLRSSKHFTYIVVCNFTDIVRSRLMTVYSSGSDDFISSSLGERMDTVLIVILLLLLLGGGGGLYWGLGAGWGIGPIGLIVAVVVIAFLLNGSRGRL
jgi:hypothetical protein